MHHIRPVIRAALCAVIAACLVSVRTAPAADAVPFKVRAERPRIWVRADEWAGPSIPKLKEWFKLPEYEQRGVKNFKVLQYLVNGDQAAGAAAVAELCKMQIGGSSPSYSGVEAQKMASRYDWLRNHPDFTAEKRAPVVAHLEKWGDEYRRYVTGASAPIYYSRYPCAIGGLALIGLALKGDSPKADAYVAAAYNALIEYGRARQYEDGASAGGTYSIHHAFPDLARAVMAFESATDADLLKYIREKQGNWLEGQLMWQIWETYPTGYFLKEGDLWQQPDSRQTRMNVDVLTSLLQNGYGRTHADLMFKRWGARDYHPVYVWEFFVFNNPEVKPKPLSELGRGKLFGRDSHGYVFFRDGWEQGNTHIFFRCGEGLDVHSNRGAGGIDIFRHRTLAQRANSDYPKDDDHIQFSNSMMFNDHNHPNTEMKNDVPLDFDGFLKKKEAGRFEWGSLLAFEATDKLARAKADLSAAVREDCKKWTRELVFLDYKYLIVVDRVETLDKPVTQKWLMHFCGETKLDGKLATTVVGDGKLFCQTLLPDGAVLTTEKVRSSTRLIVSPKGGDQRAVTYVHVLFPTEATVAEMPAARCQLDGARLTVTVGDSTHVFEN